MRITSVSPVFPTNADRVSGVFVKRRIDAMRPYAQIDVIKLEPWFKRLPKPTTQPDEATLLQKFFYIPMASKHWDGRFAFRALRGVIGRLNRNARIDAIDAHFGYPTGVACYLIGRELSVPTFITIRGNEIDHLRNPRIRKQLVDAMENCAGVIAVSGNLEQAAIEAGLRSSQVTVIPNGIDTCEFLIGDRVAARKQLGIAANDRLIVSVAKLNSVKRLDLLIEAFRQIRISRKLARLVIVGGPDYDKKCPQLLKRLISNSNLQGAVHITGIIPPDRVRLWLQAADVFALASDREGSCNSVREALACGIPVVATRVGDNTCLIRDQHNGFLVSVGDAQDMTNKLVAAMDNDWDADQIAATVAGYRWSDAGSAVMNFMKCRL